MNAQSQRETFSMSANQDNSDLILLASVEILVSEHADDSPNSQESDLPCGADTPHTLCTFNSEQNLTTETLTDRKEEAPQKQKKCPEYLHVKSVCVALMIVTIVLAAGVTIPVVLGVRELEDEMENSSRCLGSCGCNYTYSGFYVNATVSCQEDFYQSEDGGCLAECGKYEYWPHNTERIINALFTLGAATGTAAGVVVLTVSCIRHKRLLKFPSVFIIYQTLTLLSHDVVALVGRTDADNLFCNSRSINESSHNPTAFCVISGMVFVYSILQILIWWCFHVVAIFWTLKFPFHFRSYQRNGKIKYIHSGLVIIGILIPLAPALAPFAGQGFGFSIRFPPLVCGVFDLFVVVCLLIIPGSILVLIGASFLIGVFWIIIKQRRMMKNGKHNTALTLPEVKVLIVICFFLSWFGLAVIAFTIFFFKRGEANEAETIYFECENQGLSGVPGCECDRSMFEQAYFPALGPFDFLHTIVAIFPAINLVYIVDIKEVRRRLIAYRSSKQPRKSSTNIGTTSS